MAFQGYLSEHSLAKIFQFIQRGFRTGLLSLTAANNTMEVSVAPYYVWFQSGRIMAVARDLEHTGLLGMIKKRKLMSPADIFTEHCQLNSLEQPLGLYLHENNALDTEELRLLFQAQIIQPICTLFKTDQGEFHFDEKTPLVWSEMTGMSIAAAEAILLGLRVLRNWNPFTDQLPATNKGLKKLRSDLPAFKLDTQEMQVWELANGYTSIAKISEEIYLPILTVQQIGLRLMMTDLVKEVVPDFQSLPVAIDPSALKSKNTDSHNFNVFTTDIKSFLRKHG